MTPPVISTKLFIPPPGRKRVPRPRLNSRLNAGLHGKLTLISAPAGFGKTTLVSEWLASVERPVAWLSLDPRDNDPSRFLIYLLSALRTIAPSLGQGLLGILQSPQPPPVESVLASLLNDLTAYPDPFLLVLDDVHVLDNAALAPALTFLLDHQPPQMHLVLVTRQDPPLALGRLRARGQLTELRAADLRFAPAEASRFLNQVMGLNLSTDDIRALETRTEGWIAGLQLAALALQGHTATHGQQDKRTFIQSFTGSHRYVMDYLMEQVLQQQPESIQNFLLRTSILDRMCGPLCDAVLAEPNAESSSPISPPSSVVLESLERANLFLIPLDDERRWYRYHHLFADLLRQRLNQIPPSSANGSAGASIAALHIRSSQWYEDNGSNLEAFQHAAAANDIDRAERLMTQKVMPFHLTAGVTPILEWLGSLPTSILDARPWLWVSFGAIQLISGRTDGVEQRLQAGETALQASGLLTPDGLPATDRQPIVLHLVGQIASARATLALTRYDVDAMLAHSSRALEFLQPSTVPYHTALWVQGFAHSVLGERAKARRSFNEGISVSRAYGDIFSTILSTIGLGNIQERDNELHEAADTYRLVLELAGDNPQQIIHEAHLGLARVLYQWNDLDGAERHGAQALYLAQQYDTQVIDRHLYCQIFLARLKLARGDVSGATALLAQTEASARQPHFAHRLREIAAVQVLALLRAGNIEHAAQLADEYSLPRSQVRIHLAQGDASAALALLEPLRREDEATGWQDERLKLTLLKALAHQFLNDHAKAIKALREALELAEPGGYIRIFLDEGPPMAQLLQTDAARDLMPHYVAGLLSAFAAAPAALPTSIPSSPESSLVEPLSPRELEILTLLARGLSNQEISDRLHLALNTVKGHNRRIFDKLQVQRRTEAIARARDLGLL